MARPKNTAARRAEIAAGLIAVMATKGYDGATIADVARAAGLSPGVVHYHFGSKLEILLAALETLVERHEAALEVHLAALEAAPASQVAGLIDFHLGLGTADPAALGCWILLGGEALREPSVGAAYRKVLERLTARLEAMIETGRSKGAFRCEDSAACAAALVAAMQGYFLLGVTARACIPRGSAAASTKQMAEGLLRPARRAFIVAHAKKGRGAKEGRAR